MNIFQSIILGLVEGVTEFLPISSTFHLIWVSKLLGIPQSDFQTFFNVFIQSGAILAVVVVYFRFLLTNKQYIKNILISFIPTAIIGFVLHDVVKHVFFKSDVIMLSAFLIVGIIFIIIEHLIHTKKLVVNKSLVEITIRTALIIGVCQALAVIPGVSRAGAVMVGMMIMGFKRGEAALYSFLLAVPTIFAAGALDFIKTDFSILNHGANLIYLAVGFGTSFLSALIVIKWLIKFLQNNSLKGFGIYRIITSCLLFFVK